MAVQYKTPGVYVVEKDAFGSSIVANATAVPVFIGFTEKAIIKGTQEIPKVKLMQKEKNVHSPFMIRSMLEYGLHFGGPDTNGFIHVKEEVKGHYVASIKDKDDSSKDYQPGLLHPSIANYFANGGGSCYVISLGEYSATKKDQVNMEAIIKAIEEAEQATLILPLDLMRIDTDKYYSWCNQLIDYCEISKKLFCVLDVVMEKKTDTVLNEKDVKNYREKVTSDYVKYAAAYYPYLKSLTPYAYKDQNVIYKMVSLPTYSTDKLIYTGSVTDNAKPENILFSVTYGVKPPYGVKPKDTPSPAISITKTGKAGSSPKVKPKGDSFEIALLEVQKTNTIEALEESWSAIKDKKGYDLKFHTSFDSANVATTSIAFQEENYWKSEGEKDEPLLIKRASGLSSTFTKVQVSYVLDTQGHFKMEKKANQTNSEETLTITLNEAMTAKKLEKAIDKFLSGTDPGGEKASIKNVYSFTLNPVWGEKTVEKTQPGPAATSLEKWLKPNNGKIQEIKTFLANNYINLPASPFIAGIYSRIDNASGVWTPPANTAPTGITGPVVNLTHRQQESFNVDATSGKSINAIRSFTGKGTLVWGARTNEGNSMDWRYVNVVRLFISMETDISKALEAYVFKPNVHNTWVEVKTMIDSYLFGLFNAGAFAGTTPETSYQVSIGVGETMTDEDVLNGYMRASIQVAPVRPAEFIELTFSQMIGQ